MAAKGNPVNILTGPVALFRGEPGAEPSAITQQVGYTEDGLQIQFSITTEKLYVDEEKGAVASDITDADLTVSFQMAEATLQNFQYAYGLASDAYDAGSGELTIAMPDAVEYTSLKAIGKAPNGKTRTYWFPRVAVTGQTQTAIRKGQKALVPIELDTFITVDQATQKSFFAKFTDAEPSGG